MGETRDAAPDRHLRMLPARAQNPFDISDEVLERLSAAVLCRIDGHAGARGLPAPGGRCGWARHTFLLADGSEVRLYELEHNLTGGEGLVCEVYPDEAVAERAALRYARARGIEL